MSETKQTRCPFCNSVFNITDAQLAAEQALGHDKGADASTSLEWKAAPGSRPLVIAAWLAVGIPLLWGVWVTVQKTAVLFH